MSDKDADDASVRLPDPEGIGRYILEGRIARGAFVEFTFSGSPRPDENTFEAEVELTLTEGLLLRVGYGAYAVPFWGDLLFERKFD